MNEAAPTHLKPSKLGTKEYWDDFYTADLSDTPLRADSQLSGWFSDVRASSKILRYLCSSTLGLDKHATSFLDLGTGNGEMLFLLREEGGFKGRMLGVDYSDTSVHLCRKIAKDKVLDSREGKESQDGLNFEQWDIMGSENLDVGGGYDVVLDKGTFDAISLNEELDNRGRRLCEGYRERVENLVRSGGLLLVTSCNWTEEELKRWFAGGELEPVGKIEYPIFNLNAWHGRQDW